MLRRCPDVSSPHLDRDRDFRRCALGKTDAGYRWLRVQLEQPSVLLLRHSFGGPREWRSPCSGPVVWTCSSAEMSTSPTRISMHELEYSLVLLRPLPTIASNWKRLLQRGRVKVTARRSPYRSPVCVRADRTLAAETQPGSQRRIPAVYSRVLSGPLAEVACMLRSMIWICLSLIRLAYAS